MNRPISHFLKSPMLQEWDANGEAVERFLLLRRLKGVQTQREF